MANQKTVLHEYLAYENKKNPHAHAPKISSASATGTSEIFDGSLRLDFWLFSPDDILSKSSNLILYIYNDIEEIATQG